LQPNYLYRTTQNQTEDQQIQQPVQAQEPALAPVEVQNQAPVQEQTATAMPTHDPLQAPVQAPVQERATAPAPVMVPAPVQEAAAAPPAFTPPEPLTPQAVPVVASSGAAPAAAGDPAQYTLGKLRLSEAHNFARGSNVLVAVIDSGIDAGHAELQGTVVGSFDALNAAEKPHSHGTAIAGAIAARSRLMGVAPAARILAIRAFGVAGTSAEATTFAILRSVEYATKQNARVINMSFAGPADPALSRHLTAARAKGIVLIAAAGNFGPKSPPQYPAADPNVIAVSATDVDDKLFNASNRGNHIAVSAPGVDILLPAPEQNYQMISGTSFAAAHVSGIAALILERKPGLSPDNVRAILQSSSKDLGPRGKDDQFGAGLVDAYQAILALEPRTASGQAPAPMQPTAAR
jgi:subtilisin family serine protease